MPTATGRISNRRVDGKRWNPTKDLGVGTGVVSGVEGGLGGCCRPPCAGWTVQFRRKGGGDPWMNRLTATKRFILEDAFFVQS